MKVGVIGLGFVGKAIYSVLNEKGIEIRGFDLDKEISKDSFEETISSEILFLALPTPYSEKKKEYDCRQIEDTLKKLNDVRYGGIIVIKSTLLPGNLESFENKFKNLDIVHNPEFLTARTAKRDFAKQKHIVLGKGKNMSEEKINKLIKFYEALFPEAEISLCNPIESESMKIFCNSFYAVKVQFFNELYSLCNKNNCDYEVVRNLMLKNNWINPMHTKVPGPDGRVSYGGSCFPKDTRALNSLMISSGSENKVLESTILERDKMRDKDKSAKV